MPDKYSVWLAICVFLANACSVVADDDSSGNTKTGDTQLLIALDEKVQAIAGIRTRSATRYAYQPEFAAYGKVLDITPLLTLQTRYQTSVAHSKSAAARLILSKRAMSRLQNLNLNEVVSTRKLQEQESQLQTDQANVDEIDLQQHMLFATSLQQWGNKLTRWFTQTSSPDAQDIIQHRTQLLQITLPVDKHLPNDVGEIRISKDGDAQQNIKVRMIERAPQVDPLTMGQPYFFLALNSQLPTGLSVSTWIHSQSSRISGVLIPHSALLWQMGQAFVYVKHSDEQFVRRLIPDYYNVTGGYFIAEAIHEGEEVVSTGAQMIFSQQLRAQIPAEDDD